MPVLSNEKKLVCPRCEDSFTPNHGNRKHCSDECKKNYSNDQAKQRRLKRTFIDRKLKKNFEILEKLMGNQPEIVKSVEFMRGAGFDFTCYTHMVEYDGKHCRGIYHYVIVMPDTQTVKIIKHV